MENDHVFAAMRLQSLAATNQARLLLGPPAVSRVDAPTFRPSIALDDYKRSVAELIPAADKAVAASGDKIDASFLKDAAPPYEPVPPESGRHR